VTIPTAGFKSLNLSHAVMILCYELLVARMGEETKPIPKLASSRELEGMYIQLKAVLQAIGFLNPENPDYWMMHIRRLFARTTLQAREVRSSGGSAGRSSGTGTTRNAKTLDFPPSGGVMKQKKWRKAMKTFSFTGAKKIVFGRGSFAALPEHLAELKILRPLIVLDRTSPKPAFGRRWTESWLRPALVM